MAVCSSGKLQSHFKNKSKGTWEWFQRQSGIVSHHPCPSVPSWAISSSFFTELVFVAVRLQSRQWAMCWMLTGRQNCHRSSPHQSSGPVQATALNQRGSQVDRTLNFVKLCEDRIRVVLEGKVGGANSDERIRDVSGRSRIKTEAGRWAWVAIAKMGKEICRDGKKPGESER